MRRKRFTSVSRVMLAAIGCSWVCGAALATNHVVRIHGLTAGSNGDSRVQALEMRIDPGQSAWGPAFLGQQPRAEIAFFDAFGEQVFVFQFPNNAPETSGTEDPCGLRSVLIATPEFEAAYGIQADFSIPAQEMHSQAGSVCFRGTGGLGSFPINICVSYGTPQVCSGSGACCITNADCPSGQSCLQPDFLNGLIAFTDKIGGNGLSFGGGNPGCPALALPTTGVVALQRDENDPNCCHDESCHTNADFFIVNNPVFKNSLGQTASLATAPTIEQGENVFFFNDFNGNARSCGSCHLPSDGFGLRPETILDLLAQNPNDPLFANSVPGLEDPCLMHDGNQRGLILENIHGFGASPSFRISPHLMNVEHTGPFGWSPNFGGANNLRDFCQGAVGQHFPRRLPRNVDPNTNPANGLLSNRAGTIAEMTLMEEFQKSVKTVVNDGLGDLKGQPPCGECTGGSQNGITCCNTSECPGGTCTAGSVNANREDNLDRLIAEFLLACPNADQGAINAGRQTFITVGCNACHRDTFLGGTNTGFVEAPTGVVDDPGNQNTGCPLGSPGPLPNEDQQCAANPACTSPMAFDTRPLVDMVRVKKGITNPNLGTFFHDGVVRNVDDAVRFYSTPAFQNSSFGSLVVFDPNPVVRDQQISDIARFLEAIVQADPNDCPNNEGACCHSIGGCQILTEAQCAAFTCTTFFGVGTTCDPSPCPQNPIGACCQDNNVCNDDMSECDCLVTVGGNSWHEGEFCFGIPPFECPVPTGSCCLPGELCEITTEEKCLDQCGVYGGDETACGEQCCLPTRRPCCFSQATPQNPDGCTDSLLPCECQKQGGTPLPIGETCATTTQCNPPCSNPAIRPCCLPNGSCINTTQCDCLDRNGTWRANQISCQTMPFRCPAVIADDDIAAEP